MSPDLSGPLDTVSDDPDTNLSSLLEVLSQWSTHSLAQFLADHIEYLDNGEEIIQLDASQKFPSLSEPENSRKHCYRVGSPSSPKLAAARIQGLEGKA